MLRETLADGPDTQAVQDLARVKEATDRMARLLDDLLELSRIGRRMNPPEPVDLNDLIRDTCSVLAGTLTARSVEVMVAPHLPTVYGDRIRLQEVFQNLIDNAAKFMGDQPDPHIRIGVRAAPDGPVLFIHDNGIGIDPADYQRVFGLFERLDETVEGTGIGLALVQRIVTVHGGRVWFEAHDGPGTTVCLTLPSVPPDGQSVR